MRNPLFTILASLLVIGMLSGCRNVQSSEPESAPTTVPPETVVADETESPTEIPTEAPKTAADILENMSLRQKVGQLFIIRPDALDPTQAQEEIDNANGQGATALSEAMKVMLEKYPVGGIAVFAKNITSPEQITEFNTALQDASAIPLFLAVDEEGGTISRLANHPAFDLPKYESAAAVGATENPEDAWEMGSTIGAYLKEYGFNLDFAPVADVSTNPNNSVIGNRAFSSSAEIASHMTAAFADGLNSQGIIATFKHFPGHGNTTEDSHNGLAVTHRTGRQLANCEILPFLQADGNDFIMVGHIAVPEETGNMVPSSMSGYMVAMLLKGNLAFRGLVITDSLSMGAVAKEYTPEEAAVTALLAGCDVLLMPHGLAEAFDGVLTALEEGILTEQWLDETVLRILKFKILHGIIEY